MATLLLDPILHAAACAALTASAGLALWLLPWSPAEVDATIDALRAVGPAAGRLARRAAPAFPASMPAVSAAHAARAR